MNEPLQSLLYHFGCCSAVLVRHEFQIKLQKSMGKLIKNTKLVIIFIQPTNITKDVRQSFNESTTIIVKGILISNEYLSCRVFRKDLV